MKKISICFLLLGIGLSLSTVITAARMSGMGQELHLLTIQSATLEQKNAQLLQEISAGSSLHSIHDEALTLGYIDITHPLLASAK